jgi:hypothetical protein
MVVKPGRYAFHRGDEKRTLVRGDVETATMHDPGKEAAQRPPKGRNKTLNLETTCPKLMPKKYYKIELGNNAEIHVYFETLNGLIINFVV